jgi:hypothetical protein
MTLTTVNPALLDTQAQYTGFKSRIINGAMVLDQRNAGAVSSALNGYFIDRWAALRGAGTITPVFSGQQVSDAPAGYINSAKITVTTAGTGTYYSLLRQYIEGLNVSDLGFGTASAATVTLSFWVKSSIAGIYAAGIQNAVGDRAYVSNYTISTANTWEQKTITIAGDTTGTWPTNTSAGILVNFDLGTSTGTQATPNTWANTGIYTSTSIKWANTLSATFQVTGVQLEKGSTATSFDYRPYGTELGLCYRYCFAWRTDAAGYTLYGRFPLSMNSSTTQANVDVFLPTTMRNTSYSVTYNNRGYQEYLTTGGGANGSTITLNTDANGINWVNVIFTFTGTALTTNSFSGIRFNGVTDAALIISTEL